MCENKQKNKYKNAQINGIERKAVFDQVTVDQIKKVTSITLVLSFS